MMYYYPVMLDLRGKKCLVAGGGRIAIRKVIGLIRAEASVTVISPEFNNHFSLFDKKITRIWRSITKEDISGELSLVVAATNQQAVNTMVSVSARKLNIPCNVVDQPDLCSFIVPAVVRRGEMTISVSTNAVSPMFSRYVKKQIVSALGNEYTGIVSSLARIRLMLRERCCDQAKRFALWGKIFETDPVSFVQEHGLDEYDKYLTELIADQTGTNQQIGLKTHET